MSQILSQIINRINKIVHSQKEVKDFAEGSKILLEIRKLILLNYQNIYVERSKLLVARISQFFAALLIIFKVPTKLFCWPS